MADSTISGLPLGAAVAGTDLFESVQADNVRQPASALKTFMSASPALVTPNLGTPSAGVLTNTTGLPIATGVAGLGAGVSDFLVTPSSANLATAVTGETGSGALVFGTSPALTTPDIGAATGTSLSVTGQLTSTVATGTAPLAVSSTTNVPNLNASSLSGATFAAPGAIGGGTPSTGAFTSASVSTTFTLGGDVILQRDAANELSLRNGANPQLLNVYNTFTDASNYERGRFYWSANALNIGSDNLGTGSARPVNIRVGGTARWQFATTGHLNTVADNTYDIGASAASRPRTGYFGTSVVSALLTSTGGVKAFSATAIPAGGTAGSGLTLSSATNFGVFFGSGAPSLSAAKGSLYLRSDGSGATDRAYINTDGGTTWTALTTVG